MELKGKKIGVLIEDIYEDLELWYPVLRFREAGAKVKIIGPEKKVYKSKHGYEAAADTEASKAKGADFDAVIIPGGYAPDRMRRHPAMVKLVRDAMKKGKCVAAICHGGWMLCSAGGLEGRTVTGFIAIKDDLVNAGAKYVDKEVCVDGNIVTSRTPADLPAFCRAIIKILLKDK
ncbi:MAG: type 1 glutamine amidotransferase domain-containing protein [bacterium]